jgi:hypothetical protein
MEPEEEKTYEVKDKRHFNPDGTPREDAPEEAEFQAKAEERVGGQEQAEKEEAPPPNVYALLGFVSTMLAESAWQFMGIRLAPGQKELIKDLGQAKVAIDTIVFISDKLHPHITDEERAFMRGLISDLQMNYVRQLQG